jgi:hypothetical protein
MEEVKIFKLKNGVDRPENYTGCVEHQDGTKTWYKEGKLHRESGPAIEYADGDKLWYCEDVWHKTNGPAAISYRSLGEEIAWACYGMSHRINGPSYYVERGNKYWYNNNLLHRLDGPAVEFLNGEKSWFIEDERLTEENWKKKIQELIQVIELKEDQSFPVNYTGIIKTPSGGKFWLVNGLAHRLDGPASELADGSKFWYKKGLLHRLDGPACEYANGDKNWYFEGKLHRIDGPAIEHSDGLKEWYTEGKFIKKEEGK